MINVIFLFIYIFCANIFTGEYLIYISTVQCFIYILLHLKNNKKEVVTPIFIFYISIILVNYANLSLIWDYQTGNLRSGSYLVPKHIDQAINLLCLSNTMIILGYNFAMKKSLPSIAIEINNKKVFQIIFLILLVINAGKIFIPGFLNFSQTIFKLLNIFSILFFARLWTKENNKTYKMYALILYGVITYVALISAFLRFDLILPTVSLFAGYFIGKGNLKYLFSYRIVPFLIVLLLFSSVFKKLQSNRTNFYSVFFEEGLETSRRESENTGTGLLERSSNLSQLTSAIRLVEQNGFYNGRASEPLIAAIIPRFIWPEKPAVALGGWFAIEITGGHLKSGVAANNSINMTVPGELYLDFGWWGVLVGSFLFGAFFPLLWNATQFYTSEYNLAGILFGGYLFILSTGGFGGDLQIIISLLSLYLTFLIIKKIAYSNENFGRRPALEGK